MKLNKHFTIDYELNKLLCKESNASDLVNTLLWSHFKGSEESEEDIIKKALRLNKENEEKKAIKIKRDKESNKLRKSIEKEMKNGVV